MERTSYLHSLRRTNLHLRRGNPVYIEAEETLSAFRQREPCLYFYIKMKYYERRERRQAAPSFIRGINKIPPFDISKSPPLPLAEGRPMGAGDAGRISGGLSLIVFDWSLPPPSHTPSNLQTFTVNTIRHGEIKKLGCTLVASEAWTIKTRNRKCRHYCSLI
jgi:hypothetical protein